MSSCCFTDRTGVCWHMSRSTKTRKNGHENENRGLPVIADEPWSWGGDSMDYDLASFAMASHVRLGFQNDRQSG